MWLFTACLFCDFVMSCDRASLILTVISHRYLIPQQKGCLYLSLSVVPVHVRTHCYGNTKKD